MVLFSSEQSRTPAAPRRRPCAAAAQIGGGVVLLLLALAGCDGAGIPPVPSAISMVTIAAEAVPVTENDPLNFIVRAEPAPRSDLTVAVAVTYGACELAQSSYSVTITAGDSRTMLAVPTAGAADCTVTATIAAGEAYRTGTDADASASAPVRAAEVSTDSQPLDPKVTSVDPEVTIRAAASRVVEGSDLSFTLTAAPPPASALTVNVSWSDVRSSLTAPGPRTVTIPTSGMATFAAATDDDRDDAPDGRVTVTIADGSGYTIGTPGSATVAVTDNDPSTTGSTPSAPQALRPLVDIREDALSVIEGNPASFTLTAEPAPESDLTVSMTWSYDRARIDGEPPEEITFTAGSSTASFTVQTVDNDESDGDDRITVGLSKRKSRRGNNYGLGFNPGACVEIEDDEPPPPPPEGE